MLTFALDVGTARMAAHLQQLHAASPATPTSTSVIKEGSFSFSKFTKWKSHERPGQKKREGKKEKNGIGWKGNGKGGEGRGLHSQEWKQTLWAMMERAKMRQSTDRTPGPANSLFPDLKEEAYIPGEG